MRLPTKTGTINSLAILIALPLALSCSSAKSHKSDRAALEQEGGAANPVSDDANKSSAQVDEHGNTTGQAGDTTVTPANVGGNGVTGLTVKVGVRNFQAINATMSTLTGIPTTNAAVVAAYAAQNSALPTESDVKSFVGSSQVAVFKLAVEYCNSLMTDATKSAAFFAPTVINDVPSKVFTATGTQAISETLINKLWGANLATLPPLAQSSATLSKLINDLLVGKAMTNKAVTTGVLVGACTTVLAAAPVTLY